MSRPGYTNTQADINKLKSLRRDWNRNQKYTPQGMQVSGVTTPMEAQDAYMGMSRDLRQGNKPAYNKMYPLTGGFMDVAEKGGIWGAMLSNLAKKGLKKADPLSYATGIGSNVSDLGRGFWGDLKQMGSDIFGGIGIGGSVPRDEATEEVLKSYADKTFGPIDIHEDEEVIEEKTPEGNLISDELWESIGDFDPDTIGAGGKLHAVEDITVPPWLLDPSLPMPEELTEGEYLPGQYHDTLIKKEVPAPLDDFDPNQKYFKNRSEYDEWLRRKRLGY